MHSFVPAVGLVYPFFVVNSDEETRANLQELKIQELMLQNEALLLRSVAAAPVSVIGASATAEMGSVGKPEVIEKIVYKVMGHIYIYMHACTRVV